MAALGDVAGYVPVDIAPEVTFAETRLLKRDFPGLAVHPVVAAFTAPFSIPFGEQGAPPGRRRRWGPGAG